MLGELEQNALLKMNVIEVATDKNGHEAIKSQNIPKKTRANVHGVKFITAAKTNMDTR